MLQGEKINDIKNKKNYINLIEDIVDLRLILKKSKF